MISAEMGWKRLLSVSKGIKAIAQTYTRQDQGDTTGMGLRLKAQKLLLLLLTVCCKG